MAYKAILTNNSVKKEMGFLYVNCGENEQKERKEKKNISGLHIICNLREQKRTTSRKLRTKKKDKNLFFV